MTKQKLNEMVEELKELIAIKDKYTTTLEVQNTSLLTHLNIMAKSGVKAAQYVLDLQEDAFGRDDDPSSPGWSVSKESEDTWVVSYGGEEDEG